MDEEVEEAINYDSPIGKILLQVTELAKKPRLDGELSLVSFSRSYQVCPVLSVSFRL